MVFSAVGGSISGTGVFGGNETRQTDQDENGGISGSVCGNSNVVWTLGSRFEAELVGKFLPWGWAGNFGAFDGPSVFLVVVLGKKLESFNYADGRSRGSNNGFVGCE